MDMCCISQEDFERLNGKFVSVKSLDSAEDVATMIEVFELFLESNSSDYISDVVCDSNKNYLFVISDIPVNSFDFYDFLNCNYSGSVEINCVNAKLLFPRSRSRGIFNEDLLEEDSEEEEATGYMDEDELEDIVSGDVLKLFYPKLGVELSITREGLILGRSSKQSDYVIHGNGNVSRKHCRVYRSGNAYFVHNFEPANGTFVDGIRVPFNQDRELSEGSILLLADEEFKII